MAVKELICKAKLQNIYLSTKLVHWMPHMSRRFLCILFTHHSVFDPLNIDLVIPCCSHHTRDLGVPH